MPIVKLKVFAYITHERKLLVFSHPNSPEAGIQVPAGTLGAEESPEEGVMREAMEETGLKGLRIVRTLGTGDHAVPQRDEIHHRHFFHIECESQPPDRWRHYEMNANDGSGPIPFEFYWIALDDETPILAPGHDHKLAMLR